MYHDRLGDDHSGQNDLTCLYNWLDLALRDFGKVITIKCVIRNHHGLCLLSSQNIRKRPQTNPLDRRYVRKNLRS